MSNKQKHLEFIASNAAIFLIFIGITASLIFYLLDSFYLYQERLFRGKYEEVRKLKEENIDFSMISNDNKQFKNYLKVVISKTELIFYASQIIVQSGVAIWLYIKWYSYEKT